MRFHVSLLRWTALSSAIVTAGLLVACAMSTTYGKGPVAVAGSPNTYEITIFRNSLESDAGADQTAEKQIKQLMEEDGANDYSVLHIERHTDPWRKDVYRVKVFQTANPRQATMAQRVGELTAEVLMHVDIPGAFVLVVDVETDKTYQGRADKDGWAMLQLPQGHFIFGSVGDNSELFSSTTHRLRYRLTVGRTDGVTYVGHVYIAGGDRVANEVGKARQILAEAGKGDQVLHEEILQPMD